MASVKNDRFVRAFSDFVRYLNVVEPFYMQDGILDCRIGFLSHDGELHFWMQDLNFPAEPADKARFSTILKRVELFMHDLNSCRSFADDIIKHSFALYDATCDELHYKVVSHV